MFVGLECIFRLRLHPPSSGDGAAWWCLQLLEGVLQRHPCKRMSQECCSFRKAASFPSRSGIRFRRETGKAVAQSEHPHPILEIEFPPFRGAGKNSMHSLCLQKVKCSLPVPEGGVAVLELVTGRRRSWQGALGRCPWAQLSQSSVETAGQLEGF